MIWHLLFLITVSSPFVYGRYMGKDYQKQIFSGTEILLMDKNQPTTISRELLMRAVSNIESAIEELYEKDLLYKQGRYGDRTDLSLKGLFWIFMCAHCFYSTPTPGFLSGGIWGLSGYFLCKAWQNDARRDAYSFFQTCLKDYLSNLKPDSFRLKLIVPKGPGYSVDLESGREVLWLNGDITEQELNHGDLVFSEGKINLYRDDDWLQDDIPNC